MNPRLRPESAPPSLARLVRGCASVGVDDIPERRRIPSSSVAEGETRRAAVLVLFGDRPDDPTGHDLLLTERAPSLRDHAGQAAFPGGGLEPADDGPVATALREAAEETGLDPSGVVPLALLPALTIPVSGFAVTPVIGYWATPSPVRVVDPAETAAVVRVPVAELADPARRFRVQHPSGIVGPAFAVGGLLVWGFTAGLVDWVLDLAGWSRPWDTADVRDLASAWAQRHELSSVPGAMASALPDRAPSTDPTIPAGPGSPSVPTGPSAPTSRGGPIR